MIDQSQSASSSVAAWHALSCDQTVSVSVSVSE